MLTGSQLSGSPCNRRTHTHLLYISHEYTARGLVQDDLQGIDIPQSAILCNSLISHVLLHMAPLMGTEVEQDLSLSSFILSDRETIPNSAY